MNTKLELQKSLAKVKNEMNFAKALGFEKTANRILEEVNFFEQEIKIYNKVQKKIK